VLIFRYLAKEVFTTLLALTSILLLIFMSNQFVLYLSRAANGQIPAMFILKLMALELPMFMGLLLPLGFYMALLLAYGRLYAESEMTVLHACGYGPPQLLKHSLIMASGVAAVVLVILLWVNPAIAVERVKLLRSSGIQVMIKTLVPGTFTAASGGKDVFYVENMNKDHDRAEGVFLARLNHNHKKNEPRWDILWADEAYATHNKQSGTNDLVLLDGRAYQGNPGQADYQVASFKKYETRLPEPISSPKAGDLRSADTADLWPLGPGEYAKAAELQWRFSIPLMVIVLTLVAVPLSRVNPRAGKYARLLPAILLFIAYANLMFLTRDAVASGKMPLWLAIISLHGSMVLIGIGLMWRNRMKPS
jgi:lipopolysaccharide export system permease protein